MSRSSTGFSTYAVGVAALTTATLATSLPGPVSASLTVAESYVVPATGMLALTGHGYGHGHGMSQYGAQGAARQGLGYRQILSFYYPGTTVATTYGTIRVLISADTDHDVQVLPASGLRVRDTRTGSTYALPATPGIKTWRLRTVRGVRVLEYDNGAWRRYLPGGPGVIALTGDSEFYRVGSVVLRVGNATRAYRGALRSSGSETVNVVNLDDYVQGVVPREMPASWMAPALQAQAVAARTYAANDRAAHASRSYQTCDTTACQVYGGVSAEDPRSNAAVATTRGTILNYKGAAALTQFGSSSGGWLAAGGVPYLVAKPDPYDGYGGNPVHTWNATISSATIQHAYPSLGVLRRVLITRRDGNGEWRGRVEQMTLQGSKAGVALSGAAFRSRFGLRSQWFQFGTGTGTGTTPAPPATPPATPPPSPTQSPTPTAITQRWRAIGGYGSVLGRPVTKEYAVPGGHERRFRHGRIYARHGAAAHELHGRVLRAYVRRHEMSSRLGFPLSAPRRDHRGSYAGFEKGTLRVFRSGRVQVTYRR